MLRYYLFFAILSVLTFLEAQSQRSSRMAQSSNVVIKNLIFFFLKKKIVFANKIRILQLLVFVAALLVIYILYEVVYKGNADYGSFSVFSWRLSHCLPDPVRSGLEHVNRFWATLTAPAPHMFTKVSLFTPAVVITSIQYFWYTNNVELHL